MTHHALLRHGFDISKNPPRLGGNHDEPFWIKLGHGGEPPKHLVNGVIWLISWEGTMKMRHMLYGWFKVRQVGKCNAVTVSHCLSGTEGALFPHALGPLDQQPWFLPFVEGQKEFRDGDPVDVAPILDDLLTFVRNAGSPAPTEAHADAAH